MNIQSGATEGFWSHLRANTGKRHVLPWLIIVLAVLALWYHGPIAQLDLYHYFADHRDWLGIPNAADVLSNLGFAVVGLYGLALVLHTRPGSALDAARPGYGLFFFALVLTAFGSSWYHLLPDNARLVWDRLPIALACAGILSAVWSETLGDGRWVTVLWALVGVLGVGWWWYTDTHQAVGDLRPYLFVQFMPLLLIPLLQWQHESPRADRLAFAAAIGCYVLAKAAELSDREIFTFWGLLSGHTLKHLLSVLAGLVLMLNYARRKKADH